MNVTTFIGAIQSLSGLTPTMVLHLSGLADKMSEDERSDVAAHMAAGSEQAVEKAKNMVLAIEDGLNEIKLVQKKTLPALRNEEEAAEQSHNMSNAESSINTL